MKINLTDIRKKIVREYREIIMEKDWLSEVNKQRIYVLCGETPAVGYPISGLQGFSALFFERWRSLVFLLCFCRFDNTI